MGRSRKYTLVIVVEWRPVLTGLGTFVVAHWHIGDGFLAGRDGLHLPYCRRPISLDCNVCAVWDPTVYYMDARLGYGLCMAVINNQHLPACGKTGSGIDNPQLPRIRSNPMAEHLAHVGFHSVLFCGQRLGNSGSSSSSAFWGYLSCGLLHCAFGPIDLTSTSKHA